MRSLAVISTGVCRTCASPSLRVAVTLAAAAVTWAVANASALAQPDAGAMEAGLRWVRFNSSDFTRPRDTGQVALVDVDTGTEFKDYSQIWLGLLQLPTDQPLTV